MSGETIAGDVTIGAGETDRVRLLANAAQTVQKEYPLVHFHIVSGDRVTVTEEVDRGLIDFGLLFGRINTSKYEYIQVPCKDRFGVLMRRDSPLAEKKTISPKDLRGQPLILSRQALHDASLQTIYGRNTRRLQKLQKNF